MARGPLRISRAGRVPTVKHLGLGTLDFALLSVRGGKRSVMEELARLAMQFERRLEPAILCRGTGEDEDIEGASN